MTFREELFLQCFKEAVQCQVSIAFSLVEQRDKFGTDDGTGGPMWRQRD